MSISVEDVLKHVVPGAALAFLLYTTGVITDAFVFLTRFDISVQRTSILDKSGYLFQLRNTTGGNLEGVTITIMHQLGFDAISTDNGVKVQTDRSSDATLLKLDSLPSNKTVNLFFVTANSIQINDLSVVYKNTPYRINDASYVGYSWISIPWIFSVMATFAMYVLASSYVASKVREVRQKISDAEATTKEARASAEKLASKNDERIEKLESKLKRAAEAHVRVKAVLIRRVSLLSQEVEMWRAFFVAIYRALFSSSKGSASETAMKAIMGKLGIRHVNGVRDLSEDEFLEILLSAEPKGGDQ